MPDVDQVPPPAPLTEEQRRLVFRATMTAIHHVSGLPEMRDASASLILLTVMSTAATVARAAGCDVNRMLASIAQVRS